MATPLRKPDISDYERDFAAWSEDQAQKLRERAHNGLDWDNLAEEIESSARSDRRKVKSNLEKVLLHLLEWQCQPDHRTGSWEASIREHRRRIERIIDDSPSLASLPAAVFSSGYAYARGQASIQTGLPLETFPEEPSFDVVQALDPDFLPADRNEA